MLVVSVIYMLSMSSSSTSSSSSASSVTKTSPTKSSDLKTKSSKQQQKQSSSSSSSSSSTIKINTTTSTEEYLSNKDKQQCENDKNNNSNPYALALKQSNGYFNDISCENWNRLRQITSSNNKHMYPDQPLYRVHIPHSWYQMNYEPNFSCLYEQRVGGNGNGDGPKWICDPHRLIEISNQRKIGSGSSGTTTTTKGTKNKNAKIELSVDNEDARVKDVSHSPPGCVIYSIGSNGDFQFEVGVQELLGSETCEIHIFDMGDYEKEMPKGLNLHFHHWGITNADQGTVGSSSTDESQNQKRPSQAFYEGSLQKKLSRWFGFRQETFKTFEETVRTLGHENLPAIDILKIDCEGCEWDVYKDWFNKDIPPINQILVEVHRSPKDKVIDFFDDMYNEGYATFHKEFNTQYARGNCVEYAFMKLDKDYFNY
jgi:hypothetical protein